MMTKVDKLSIDEHTIALLGQYLHGNSNISMVTLVVTKNNKTNLDNLFKTVEKQLTKNHVDFLDFVSQWTEEKSGAIQCKKTLVAKGITKQEAIKLGRTLGASSVICKDGGTIYEELSTDNEKFMSRYDIFSSPPLPIADAIEILSKSKNDNSKNYHLKKITSEF